jgi:hypothetical protein
MRDTHWLVPRSTRLRTSLARQREASCLDKRCYKAIHQLFREEHCSICHLLGVTESVAFPDLNGLAEELKNRFRKR